MLKILLSLLLATPAFSQGVGSTTQTCIWGGTVANCLPSDGLLLSNQRDLRLGEATANGSNYMALQGNSSMASNFTLTLPADDGTTSQWFTSGDGSGATSWTNTVTTGKTIDGSADEIQLTVQGNGTQTGGIIVAEKSDGTDLLVVTNTEGTDIRGTTTNDTAAAGFVGEVITAVLAFADRESLSSGAANTIASASITAGQWLLCGDIHFEAGTASAITELLAAVNTTTDAIPASTSLANPSSGLMRTQVDDGLAALDGGWDVPIPCFSLSLSATTTYYLVARAAFSDTLAASGYFQAIRLR